MPNYRRSKIAGGSWFFTVNLFDRRSRLLVANINALEAAIQKVQHRYPFQMDAMVVLPDHLHAMWTLPADDSDYSLRLRLIKSDFSKAIPNNDVPSQSRKKRGERTIWQRRFWEHAIRDQEDYNRHIEYCYINPVKHGHVKRVKDWPHSSFHRDVKRGIFSSDWAGEWDDDVNFGER